MSTAQQIIQRIRLRRRMSAGPQVVPEKLTRHPLWSRIMCAIEDDKWDLAMELAA